MALKDFIVGEVLTSSDVDVYCVNTLAAVKTSTESVTSSTTLQDDDQLFVSVAANSTYEVSCFLRYDGVAGGAAGDLKFQFVAPASAVFEGGVVRLQTGASDTTALASDYLVDAVTTSCGTLGGGVNLAAVIRGTLTVLGTAGTFKLQWAQVTSDVVATRIQIRSHLVLHRIA